MDRWARVRFIKDTSCRNVDPGTEHVYRAGDFRIVWQPDEERDMWWSSPDIDQAYIFPGSAVEVVEIYRGNPYISG